MALILNIDTAVEQASLCLADDERVIASAENNIAHTHATWIHTAVKELFNTAQLSMHAINAIAVSNGPGSYTGLRIGLATAKGLCFSLNKPLICLDTLEIMANAVKNEAKDLICPVIDARRMEIYTALYKKDLTRIAPPSAMTVDPNSFGAMLENNQLLFTGNATTKLKQVLKHSNAIFSEKTYTASNMPALSLKHYKQRIFADLSYVEPFYLKAVYFNKV
ncbi:tRNA N6-adenosine(37)-N6-threonylcarbamoyltransferase complex dimerization subunit TsaB [Niabella ginsenosidivorans]|uniref:tRNA N6-adenosine(37)-N6-threonylcarbamoyltransferase complex dimerization subunit TsaB n=1 Tax=Niabella ginsenosidivorans TaxID=1176587 RepID=A0A1A9HWG5_9BACT|nr:tRNA (adenosine(37)-N6)-threonylcarbamoyltransferase complex dimerization subunit type 1 TsaB [Niabella ginsenosidivorans]ANH79573.1 tRNA N6-adenosine(37)-N6-threonylcarbamoyltransferase complex dimerization subunit TsaB [Niabella ginsenosidivorans]